MGVIYHLSHKGPTLLLTSGIIKQRLGAAALDRYVLCHIQTFYAILLVQSSLIQTSNKMSIFQCLTAFCWFLFSLCFVFHAH